MQECPATALQRGSPLRALLGPRQPPNWAAASFLSCAVRPIRLRLKGLRGAHSLMAAATLLIPQGINPRWPGWQ